MKRSLTLFYLVLLTVLIAACQTGQNTSATPTPAAGKPTVVIVTPASNASVQSGDQVQIQSTATDAQGIVLVELSVDGQSVQNSPTPNGQPQQQFSVIQTWTATNAGTHTITVKATNAKLGTGEASISLNVTSKVALATPTSVVNTAVIPTATPIVATAVPPATATGAPTATSPAPTTCTLASTFINDVTIPDGTVIAPRGTFVKTWAIQNSGTCTWGGGYNAVLVGGEAFGAASPQPIPSANPGDIVNLSVNMVAPTSAGPHTSVWQIQASNGVSFGTKFDVVINIPGAPTAIPPTPIPPTPIPPPVGCTGTPVFSSFSASPQTITAGQFATLSWGPVSNATTVYLTTPSGTQGVGTPGAIQVQPSQTTTYTLTAYCGTTPAQIQVTLNVQGGGGGCNGTPVFNGFYANPQTISAGQQTTLYWGLVQNANAVFLQMPNQTVGVASPGSRVIQPKTTTTYTLVAYCGNNKASLSMTVNVNGTCSGNPVFNGFTANPSTIQKGQSSTLSWGFVGNATSVVLQTPDGNSGVATPGQLAVSPNKTTTYTLVAYCANKSKSLSVTITVNNPKPPTPTPTPGRPDQIIGVQVQRPQKAVWTITVNYFWNGDFSPASMSAVGEDAQGNPVTTPALRSIIAGFVKYVTLTVNGLQQGRPAQFTVCMIGRGATELVCKTVTNPTP